MYKYKIYYDGGLLCDSSEMNEGYTFETEEEAKEDAEMEIESRITDWEIEGCEYDKELFEVIIEEV